MRALILTVVLAVGSVWSNPCHGMDCSVLEKEFKPGSRGGANPDEPRVKQAQQIWDRVQGVVESLTQRRTQVRFLSAGPSPEIAVHGPGAWTCPGGPPTVYVTHALVELALAGSQPKPEYLAFVFGHELGHRVQDVTEDGASFTGVAARTGLSDRQQSEIEATADARAAFFATGSGHSLQRLSANGGSGGTGGPDEVIVDILRAHNKVSKGAADIRAEKLRHAFATFPGWDGLYTTGVALALLGGKQAEAERLLAWAVDRMRADLVPAPELLLIEAQVILLGISSKARALSAKWSPLGPLDLTCAPVLANRTAFAPPEGRSGGLMAGGESLEETEANARKALKLLEEARDLGASPGLVEAAIACARFYLADAAVASDAQQRAGAAFGKSNPQVAATLRSNAAAIRYLQASLRLFPGLEGLGERTKMKAALAPGPADVGLFRAHPALAREFGSGSPSPLLAPPSCRQKSAWTLASFVKLPDDAGKCHTDQSLVWSAPDPASRVASGTTLGVTACRGKPGTPVHISIRLAGDTSKAIGDVRRDLVQFDGQSLPPHARSVADWACICPTLIAGPVSEGGLVSWTGVCRTGGVGSEAFETLVLASTDGVVQRAVMVE